MKSRRPRLARLPYWETRLSDYVRAAQDRPYVFGEHDCLLHCAAAVEALTGVDLGAPHRGKYSNEAGAVRHLRRRRAASPEAFLDRLFPERPPAFARRGDIVLSDGVPGVCVGHTAVFAGDGLIHKPREAWSKAWSVGDE